MAYGRTNSGGRDTSDATATAGDILSPKTAYVNNEKITGTITTRTASSLSASGATVTVPAGYYASQVTKSVATATHANPTASINTSTGLVTASHTQSAGYVTAGTTTGTLQLTTVAATAITPGATAKTAVAANRYTTGAVTVNGDSNLKAANIKSGVSIFGVTGSYIGTDTSDATATAAKILSDYTAYVATGKVTGTIQTKTASDVTASGATVTVPAGYYASKVTKSVTTTTHANPTATVNSSTGLVTASHTQTAGYVSAGTTTGTLQLSTQAAKAVTPGTTAKTAVAAGKYTTGAVTVNGDANLIASNIKSGVSIFGVTGTASSLSGGADLTNHVYIHSDDEDDLSPGLNQSYIYVDLPSDGTYLVDLTIMWPHLSYGYASRNPDDATLVHDLYQFTFSSGAMSNLLIGHIYWTLSYDNEGVRLYNDPTYSYGSTAYNTTVSVYSAANRRIKISPYIPDSEPYSGGHKMGFYETYLIKLA